MTAAAFDLGMATRPAAGEVVCGDAVRVFHERSGAALFAVVDGLGHGPLAAEAAEILCTHVEGHAAETLDELVHGASRALAGSRGAAAAFVRVHAHGALEFCGVGNVALQARAAGRLDVWSLPGILGRRIRTPRIFRASLATGDLVALHTDGIARFDVEALPASAAQDVADHLIRTSAKVHDDAGVLVVRFGAIPG